MQREAARLAEVPGALTERRKPALSAGGWVPTRGDFALPPAGRGGRWRGGGRGAAATCFLPPPRSSLHGAPQTGSSVAQVSSCCRCCVNGGGWGRILAGAREWKGGGGAGKGGSARCVITRNGRSSPVSSRQNQRTAERSSFCPRRSSSANARGERRAEGRGVEGRGAPKRLRERATPPTGSAAQAP